MQKPAAPAAAPGQKRARDNSSSVSRFKTEIFGVNGFRKLMAMVERNPAIMYPPDGCAEARERAQLLGLDNNDSAAKDDADARKKADEAREREINEFLGIAEPPARTEVNADAAVLTSTANSGRDAEEEDFLSRLLLLRGKRQQAQNDSPGAAAATTRNEEAVAAAAAASDDAAAAALLPSDSNKATYHRQQLTSFMATLYEFNHVTFSKLQLRDMLLQLMRCGRESFANMMDFEAKTRLERFGDQEQVLQQQMDDEDSAAMLGKLKADGRDAYFNDQLQSAEARAEALETAPDELWGGENDNDDDEDDELWEELRKKQARLEDEPGTGENENEAAQTFHDEVEAVRLAHNGDACGDGPVTGGASSEVPLPESVFIGSTAEALPAGHHGESHVAESS